MRALIIFVTLLSGNAYALSGADLYSMCNDKADNFSNDLACSSYLRGITDGIQISQMSVSMGTYTCLPKDKTLDVIQSKFIIEKYVREHPEKLNQSAYLVVWSALVDAFPCDPKIAEREAVEAARQAVEQAVREEKDRKSDWSDHYSYTGTYGKTAGGSPIVMDYKVTIAKGEKNGCEIEINGYQTEKDILCTTQKQGNSIVLLFKSYKSGDTKNIHGVAEYKPEQPLIALEHVDEKGKTTLITHWLGLTDINNEQPKPGVYFQKN